MLGGADNPNGELPSYITGANTLSQMQKCTCDFLHSAVSNKEAV
ncbi:hypothetical protein ACBQ85_02125 [Escherichia coli]